MVLGTCAVEIIGVNQRFLKFRARARGFNRAQTAKLSAANPLATYPRLRYRVRSVALLLAAVFVFGVALVGSCHFTSAAESRTVEELARFYLLLVNGARTRSYEMNTRFALRYLTLTGAIDEGILADFPEAPRFSEYLRNTTAYLGIMDPLNGLLMRPNQSAYAYYSPLFGKTLPLTSPANVDFFSFLSLAKSFYHEA